MSKQPDDRPTPNANPGPDDGRPSGILQLVRDLLALPRGPLLILVTVPLVLTLMEYYGQPWHYNRYRELHSQRTARSMTTHVPPGRNPPFAELVGNIDLPGPLQVRHYVWWGLACLVLYILIPMLVGRVGAGLSPRRLGVRLKGTGRDALTYLLLFLIFFPVVYLVSRRPDFQRTYPFYKGAKHVTDTDFLVFEAVYCLQFFAIEFFFRGFIVLGLKRWLGWASVLVMLAPYCMIHYYKPMPEALGAIAAGLVLGTLAWRTNTIIYGWFLHYAVALSMDLLALHHTGGLS